MIDFLLQNLQTYFVWSLTRLHFFYEPCPLILNISVGRWVDKAQIKNNNKQWCFMLSFSPVHSIKRFKKRLIKKFAFVVAN